MGEPEAEIDMNAALFALAMAQATQPGLVNAHPLFGAYQRAQQDPARLSMNQIEVQWQGDSQRVWVELPTGWVQVDRNGTVSPAPNGPAPQGANRPRTAGRGQSFRTEPSPSSKMTLVARDGSLFVQVGGQPDRLIRAGEGRRRIGEVAWVYGEELSQNRAMGWSPDEAHIWFYEFDNNPVKPFAMVDNISAAVSRPMILDYPKAGDPNPIVSLWVAKADGSGQTRVLMTEDPGAAYIYDIRWWDAHRLVYLVANRLQSKRSIRAFDVRTGTSTVLWEERTEGGYIASIPEAYRFTPKGILTHTERNGFANWVLIPPTGPARVLTNHAFEVGNPLTLTDREIFYTSQGGKHPHARQVHSVRWDGSQGRTYSDPNLTHDWAISPDGTLAIARSQGADQGLTIRMVNLSHNPPKTLAEFSIEDVVRPRVRPIEFKSADGKFSLWMNLHLPPNYDSRNRYPVIFDVYNGPETNIFQLIPRRADPITAFGVMVAEVETRGGLGRGAAFRNSLYGKLGVAEIDDLHQAVKKLDELQLIDPKRVGIYGTSYGGYAVLLAMLRYPEAFQVGVASAAVTDWRHYDTIYTERYMGLPQENKDAYDAGSAIRLAPNLKGDLLLFFGMADDNVHSNQSLAMLEVMRRNNIYPDVVIGPREGHAFVGMRAALAYFIEKLKL